MPNSSANNSNECRSLLLAHKNVCLECMDIHAQPAAWQPSHPCQRCIAHVIMRLNTAHQLSGQLGAASGTTLR